MHVYSTLQEFFLTFINIFTTRRDHLDNKYDKKGVTHKMSINMSYLEEIEEDFEDNIIGTIENPVCISNEHYNKSEFFLK